MATVEESSAIAGVFHVRPKIFADARGYFVETYRREWIPGASEMIQQNRADRSAGSVVGLHYHLHQADYWYVPNGRARAVLHDLRTGSPTEGATECFDLGGDEHPGVYIPPRRRTRLRRSDRRDDHVPRRRLLRPERRDSGSRGTTPRSRPIGASPIRCCRIAILANPEALGSAGQPSAHLVDADLSMRLCVTGGAGFIGANFVRYWSAQHPDDRIVVRRRADLRR